MKIISELSDEKLKSVVIDLNHLSESGSQFFIEEESILVYLINMLEKMHNMDLDTSVNVLKGIVYKEAATRWANK